MRNHFQVSLKLSRLSVNNLLGLGSAVVSHVNSASATFTTPSPALSDVSSALADLQTAMENSVNGGKTDVATMNAKRVIVEQLLTDLAHYVESVANDPANDGNEEVIIDSAGMTVKRFTPRQKQVFAAAAGRLEGTVKLVAGGVARGFHEWAYTLTPENPTSWTELTPTTKAQLFVTGLTRGDLLSFRHRTITKEGRSDWETTTAVIVP